MISLGYLTYGYPGALLALFAITIPACLVLVISGLYQRLENQRWVAGVMRGISLAVVGVLLTVCYSILNRPGVDWKTLLIAAAAFGLAASKRINIIVILVLAGLVGYLLYGLA